MRCLNSPAVLNSLEVKIVESTPGDARHVLVVNAGDGRLARAVKEKLGDAATVSVVTLQPGLVRYVDDFASRSDKPWDFDWLSRQVAAHGAFDYVIVYQLHEFWGGELYQYTRLLELAKPGALVWTTFLNAQANRMISRYLPPVRLGFSALADPVRCASNVDFASFLDFAVKFGNGLEELWGLLDQNAQEFCQNLPAKPVQWELRGGKVSIGTIADAFLWGAAVVGVAFRMRGGSAAPATPKASFSPYSTNLLQALLLPYPDEQMKEGALVAARLEIEAWKQAPMTKVGSLAKFAFDQLGETDKPKRVLLVGAGWGRDLLLFKRNYPAWEWVGFESNKELAALGEGLLAAEGLTLATAERDDPMPFEDRSFDLVLSFGHFSTLHERAARKLAQDVRRVAKGPIHHLEDGRGPDQGLHLKTYSLKGVYASIGAEMSVQPVLVNGSPTGMYLLKVHAAA